MLYIYLIGAVLPFVTIVLKGVEQVKRVLRSCRGKRAMRACGKWQNANSLAKAYISCQL